MFSLLQINGASLPDKTLCLTFDDGPGETMGDGPGPKTVPLAAYLNSEGIQATFFCVGKFIDKHPGIIAQLDKLGHFVGNHSYSHPDMIKIFESGRKEEVLKEIRATDDQIRKIIPGKTVYFRAPYGLWKSKISNYLNKNLVCAGRYTGPFHWDIGGHDFRLWEKKETAESCAASYLQEIEQKKKGIILMHDSSADVEKTKQNNRTFETLRILIPLLKERGYKFVGLDKVQVSNNGSDRIRRLLKSIPDMYSLKRQVSIPGVLLLSLWKALTRS